MLQRYAGSGGLEAASTTNRDCGEIAKSAEFALSPQSRRCWCGHPGSDTGSASGALVLPGAFVDLVEFLAPDAHQFRLAHFVQHQRALLAARLTATALLLRFEVEQLAGLQVTFLS